MLYHGYSQTEIAKELGVSKPAVSIRLGRIAEKLQGFGLAAA
jgi:predicted transcriptional regulator